VWPEVVMENHTHTPAVHGKSHIRADMEFPALYCFHLTILLKKS
jgi:hypothetical protein